MRTLTRLTKAPEAAPAETNETTIEMAPESIRAREDQQGRTKSDGPLAREVETSGSRGGVGYALAHESAVKHVTGRAAYIDDLKAPADALHVALGLSPVAHGRLTRLDLDKMRSMPGVVDVVGFHDVPGHTDIGPVFPGDPLFVDEEISYVGQVIFAVAAESQRAARVAVAAAWAANVIEIDGQPPCLDPVAAAERGELVRPTHVQQNGDWEQALQEAQHVLECEQFVGGQEHFYLEGQACLVLPTEDEGVIVYTSNQHPSETQKLVAEVLGIAFHAVTVEVRRMGGGFGGKETQASPWACIAALIARRTARAARVRLPRAEDMHVTGKRHPFHNYYRLGVDAEGVIQGGEITLTGDCGYSPDLSDAIVDRAMFHSDNAYSLGDARVTGYRARTHTASNTAFRGFGGPQGMIVIEAAMDDIARRVGEDPLTVRKRNFYRPDRQLTHYGQTVDQIVLLHELVERLETSSKYWVRRHIISEFNAESPIVKRGLALTPVKFGISFTAQHLNQAGALLHVYTDGSVLINHGGTEMGQGLHTKICQVVARELALDADSVRITATRTDKVPNTSPTAASSGADLNGQAARDACIKLKERLFEFASQAYALDREGMCMEAGHLVAGGGESERRIAWGELVQAAYLGRISLSEKGFYATPLIYYDRQTGQGRPFYYYAFGAAVAEVSVDTLTGEYQVDRVDILHDVGDSLNPAIDLGQVEGGFIQGMGWLTSEELKRNDAGRLVSDGPATYKIPTYGDLPPVFNVNLMEGHPNSMASIYRSKAVGEPPFMLGISVWSALRDALSSLTEYREAPRLDTPATPERVLVVAEALRTRHNLGPLDKRGLVTLADSRNMRRESWHAALHRLQRDGVPHVLATQVTSAGSTPREPGARMVITADEVFDTLGGGTFEWQTLETARSRLARGQAGMTIEAFSLGGRSGQCCGGFVNVLIEVFPGSQVTLAIFGAGHVGTELVRLAAPLLWRVLWHDSRDGAFPSWADDPPRLTCRPSPDPSTAVSALPAGAHVLVLTHDHAEDRELIDALLRRGDCASLGLIGSPSKWASFRSRLTDSGHDEAALAMVRCPIGVASGPTGEKTRGSDKTPYAIALATIAELLPLVGSEDRVDQRGLDPAELRALFGELLT